uniref:Uncharacterized protein n=1 Tax=Anopheles melas TaxID=34690 RepID=A0A182U693_9DIPT
MGFGRKHKYISTTIIAILHLAARLLQWCRRRQRQLQCKSTHAARRQQSQQPEASVRTARIYLIRPKAHPNRSGHLDRSPVRVSTLRANALGGRTNCKYFGKGERERPHVRRHHRSERCSVFSARRMCAESVSPCADDGGGKCKTGTAHSIMSCM